MKVDKSTWKKCQLRDCLKSLRTGLNPRKFFALNGDGASDFYVTVRELDGRKIAISEKTDKFNHEDFHLLNNRSNLEKGDVLFSGTGSIGRTALITQTPSNWNIKEGVYALKPNTERIIQTFLLYALHSHNLLQFCVNNAKGATVLSIPMGKLLEAPIVLPSLEEQEGIVAELDRIQGMIDGYKAQIADLDALAQSIFLDTFGDPVTNSKGWEMRQLTEFATLINGRAYSQSELLQSGKYRVLRVGNLYSTKEYYYSDLELPDNKYIENGDLIYAWSCTFGAHIWEGEKVIYHYHIWKVELMDHINKVFAKFLFNLTTDSMMNQLHGIGMMHLTKAGFEQNRFILPPLALQELFATRVKAIEELKAKIREQVADCEQVMAERMQEYFS